MKITSTATITDRGQVTLPKAVLEILGDTRSVEFEVTDNIITLRAIPDAGGSLSKYAQHSAEPLNEVREKVWCEVVNGKTR